VREEHFRVFGIYRGCIGWSIPWLYALGDVDLLIPEYKHLVFS
jgi:hypothetical protein